MDDDPDVSADPDRPEIRVFRFFQLVELQAWMSRIKLKVKCSRFDSFLLVTRQSGKAVSESVRDPKFHLHRPSTPGRVQKQQPFAVLVILKAEVPAQLHKFQQPDSSVLDFFRSPRLVLSDLDL